MKCTYVNWKSRNAIEMPVGLNRKNLVHYEMFSESTLKNNDLSPSLCKNTKLVTADGCFSKIKPHKFDAAMVYYLPPKKSEKSLKRILRIKVLEINLRKKKLLELNSFWKILPNNIFSTHCCDQIVAIIDMHKPKLIDKPTKRWEKGNSL